MNITTIIGPMLVSLVERIYSNQLTRQNINDKVDEIVNRVNYEHGKAEGALKEKEQHIVYLEQKLNSLQEKFDEMVNVKIDELVKSIQDKTPFFVDPFVSQIGEELKKNLDKFTDDAVSTVVDVVENKAKEFGLIPTDSVKTEDVSENKTEEVVKEEVEIIPSTEVELEPEGKNDGLDFLSEKNKKILDDLKNKHNED